MSITQPAEPLLRARTDHTLEILAARFGASPDAITLTVETDLDRVADIWRVFEAEADGTVFQTFLWQSTWQHHVGAPRGVTPAIVTGRGGDGGLLFLLPLAVEARGMLRHLTWLASELCDYNGPLLARDFSARVAPDRFGALWREIGALLWAHPKLAHDAVLLDKMPETIGDQANPFLALGVRLNPCGAYLTHLGTDWEAFYRDKRSSATRRRDRTKRKRLGDLGDVRFVTPDNAADTMACLEALFVQKSKSLTRMGAGDMFARPGVAEFFRAVTADPASSGMVHVSHLDVGPVMAATNFALMHGGRYYHVLASYDDGPASRFGPGAAHLHELMGYAIARGCTVFDFTIGDERYKRDWSDTELKLYDHSAAATWRGWAASLPAEAFARVKRTIKQTPFLWKVFTVVRARLGALKRSPAPASAGEEE